MTTRLKGSFVSTAWLSAGRLKDGSVSWSQPEIGAYVDGGLEGCSYPDLIEDSGHYYICATQKTEARVMDVEPGLLEALWNQEALRDVATNGLVLNLTGENCAAHATSVCQTAKPKFTAPWRITWKRNVIPSLPLPS